MAPYVLPGQDPHQVLEITTLGLPDHDAEARRVLEELSKRVQPILRARKWTVGKLAEVIPPGVPGGPPARLFRGAAGQSYYGLNIGGGDNRSCLEIRLYLRRRGPTEGPIDADRAMGVMLHELAHIKRGPHDRIFYETLDQLWAEYKAFEAKGVRGTGQGFDARPVGRLAEFGGTHVHNPPRERVPGLAAAAAERRARHQQLLSGGGTRLGGGGGGSAGGGGGAGTGAGGPQRRLAAQERGLTPAQAAAEAAERRAEDNKWCPVEVIVIEEEEVKEAGKAGGGGGGAGGGVKAERVAPAGAAGTGRGGGGRDGGGAAVAAGAGARGGAAAGGGGGGGKKKVDVVDLTMLDDD